MTSADADGRGLIVMPDVVTARIVTPGDWAELDLNQSTRRRSILLAVRRAVGRDPGLAADAVRLIKLLDDISRRAVLSGGFYCASLVLGDAAGGFVVANVLIQIAGSSDPQDATLPPATDLCAGLAVAVSNDPDWAGAEVTVVQLPFVGPAVRISVVTSGICLQYLVPLQSSSGELLVRWLGTPQRSAGERPGAAGGRHVGGRRGRATQRC
jgi:hypothetical protein